MKKTVLCIVCVLCMMMLFVTSACTPTVKAVDVEQITEVEETPAVSEEPTEPEPTEDAEQPEETEAPVISEEPAEEPPAAETPSEKPAKTKNDSSAKKDPYAEYISLYKKAINESWDPEQCEEKGICAVSYYSRLGYAEKDINGDGKKELIVGYDDTILDLYSLHNGKPVQVFAGWDRNCLKLNKKGKLMNIGSNGALDTKYIFYNLSGANLEFTEVLICDGSKDPDNPWFLGSVSVDVDDARPITEDEADAILNGFGEIKPKFTSF